MRKAKMKLINVYLTNKQVRELKELSGETELSVSELMRRAVDALTKEHKLLQSKYTRSEGDGKGKM